MRVISIIILVVLSISLSFSQEKEVVIPYTQADRDRLVRVEKRLDNVEKSLEALRVDVKDGQAALRKEMQDGQAELRNLIYSIFGLIGVLVALVIWDRRTAIKPVASRLEDEQLKVKEETRYRKQLIKVLRQAAEKDANIREAMKHAGLL